jgi:hypothetical protein
MRGGLRRFMVLRVAQGMPESGMFSHIGLSVVNARCGIREIMFQDIMHTYNVHGQKIANNILIQRNIDEFYGETQV